MMHAATLSPRQPGWSSINSPTFCVWGGHKVSSFGLRMHLCNYCVKSGRIFSSPRIFLSITGSSEMDPGLKTPVPAPPQSWRIVSENPGTSREAGCLPTYFLRLGLQLLSNSPPWTGKEAEDHVSSSRPGNLSSIFASDSYGLPPNPLNWATKSSSSPRKPCLGQYPIFITKNCPDCAGFKTVPCDKVTRWPASSTDTGRSHGTRQYEQHSHGRAQSALMPKSQRGNQWGPEGCLYVQWVSLQSRAPERRECKHSITGIEMPWTLGRKHYLWRSNTNLTYDLGVGVRGVPSSKAAHRTHILDCRTPRDTGSPVPRLEKHSEMQDIHMEFEGGGTQTSCLYWRQ